ncbi:unnamed protein product, partial [Oikopleura dioica]
CDECDKTFASKSYLADHKYVHQEEFHFNCDNCGAKFKQATIFRQHLKKCEGEIKCDKCGRKFNCLSKLKQHLHDKKVDCVMQKKFKGYLNDHKYVHKEEFRFSCEKCEAKFKQKVVFRDHVRKCKASPLFNKKTEDEEDIISEEECIEIVEQTMDSDFSDSGVEFKIPDIPKISKKDLPNSPKENNRKRKRKNLKIKARQVINRVIHYHFKKKNRDGSVTERWMPVFEVENFDDVLEFEKFMAKVEIGSEEDIFQPDADYFFC